MSKKKRELITISEYCIRKDVSPGTISRKIADNTFTAYTENSSVMMLDWLETKDFVFRKKKKNLSENDRQQLESNVRKVVSKTIRERSNAHYGKEKYARYK